MSRIKAKFIVDKSVTSDPLKLIQWDATGDLAYVPNAAGDWVTPPTGALEGIDELALRTSAIKPVLEPDAIYIKGNATTDGSWRMSVVGGDLLIEVRTAGSWVTKDLINP